MTFYISDFASHSLRELNTNETFTNTKGCTFQELGKQTMSSANFQAEHLLSRLIFDSSTFCSACKIVRTQSLFIELLKSAAFSVL